MVDDPYKILGVSLTADKDTIKKAYRQVAKKYHPDLHQNNAAECEEKMKELNEAYDMLMNPEKYTAHNARREYNSWGNQENYQQNNQQEDSGWHSDFGGFGFEDFFGFGSSEDVNNYFKPQYEPADNLKFRQAVDAINSKQYQNALNILIYVESTQRNARWYYLCSLANHNLNNTVQAIDQIQRACQLEPNNQTYNQLLRRYRRSERTYEQNAHGFDMNVVNLDKICIGLCLGRIFCGPFCRCI